MLYLLKQQESESNIYYLISGKEYVIGRKNADINISNDQSISRKHAVLKVEDNSIKLIDCGSKYGTSLKGNKMEPNTEVELEDQEVVKFGVFKSIYKLEKVNIVTTGSGLNNSQKNTLKQNLEYFGGTLLNNWDSTCTHLTLQETLLTIKVLHALIDNKPLVTLEYWETYRKCIEEKQLPPKVEDFKPPVTEMFVHRSVLNYNPQRNILFKNKTFVFPNEKVKSKMESLILKTGGECISWEKQPVTLSEIKDPKKNYIFITSDEIKEFPDSLKNMHQHLVKLGQRTISVQEVTMAILMCSCEKDCNPHFNRLEKVFLKKETDSCSEMFPLAYDTQSQHPLPQLKEEIIPGSLDADVTLPKPCSSNTREPFLTVNSVETFTYAFTPKRSREEEPESSHKRCRTDQPLTIKQSDSELKKRKAEESLDVPAKKSSLKENPFAVFKNKNVIRKIDPDNPFAPLRVEQQKRLDSNPFIQTPPEAEKKNENVCKKTEKDALFSNFNTSIESENSCVSEEKSSCLSDIKWLSKASITHVEAKETEIANDFKEIYNKFRNTVVIEVLPPTAMRFNVSDISNDSIKSQHVKNFKKFKKVHPLRPQTNIIRASVAQIASGTSNEVTVLSDGEEDDEQNDIFPRIASRNVKRTKHFDF